MNSLSDYDRAFIMECAQEAIDYNWELADQSEEEILKQLEDAGFPVNDVDISVRRQLGEKINASIKGDIIANCGEDTSSTTPRPATPMPPTVRLATPQSSVLSTRPTSCSIRRQSRHLIS